MSSNLTFPRRLAVSALLALSLTIVACRRTPILERAVNAKSENAFANWQTRLRGDFSPELKREFDEALQEVRLRIMAAGKITGAGPIEEALRKEIHDRSVREVLQDAMMLKSSRLNVQRRELENFMQENTKLQPVDEPSAVYLRKKRAEQQERLDKIKAEIQTTDERAKALGPPVAAK